MSLDSRECLRRNGDVSRFHYLGTVIMTIVNGVFPSYYFYSTMALDEVQEVVGRARNLSCHEGTMV